MRDKIYQKEYENKYKSSQKRVKVPKKVPKPSHTFIKMKRITFFLTKKGSLLRSSHRKSSIKKLFFPIKVFKSLHDCNIIKNRLQHRCFPVNIAKFLRAPILTDIYKQLLLFFKKQNYLHLNNCNNKTL